MKRHLLFLLLTLGVSISRAQAGLIWQEPFPRQEIGDERYSADFLRNPAVLNLSDFLLGRSFFAFYPRVPVISARNLYIADRDGDDRSIYRYAGDVGTLANPFDFSFFNNVALFPTAGGTRLKATSPIVPAATLANGTWTGSSSGAWLTTTNWSSSIVPGSATITNTDLATFNVSTQATVGINMNTTGGTYFLGAIDFNNGTNRTINNSSSSAGVLSLNGTTITSDNTIIYNHGSGNLTITNGSGSMGLALGNTTNNIVVIDGSGNVTIGSNITGSGRKLSLQGTGSGDLILTGTNSFTGGIDISGSGRLRLGAASSLPTTGGISVREGGRIRFTTAGTFGSNAQTLTFDPNQTANPSLDLQNSNIVVVLATNVALNADTRIEPSGASGSVEFSGNLTGSGALIKQAAGNLILSGTGNTATGGTQIGNGLLTVNSGSSLGTGSLTFAQTTGNNTAVTLNNAAQTIGPLSSTFADTTGTRTQTLTLNGTALTVNQSTNTSFGTGAVSTLTSTITGSGSLSLSNTSNGTLTLTGTNTYTGGTQINGGILSLGSSGALGTTGTISFGGGILQYGSSNTTDYSLRFSTAANQLYKVDTNSQAVTWAAALTSSGGSLTKNGAGTLTLSGANSYTGGTQINGGTLSLGSSGALGTTGTISFGGGILQYGSSNTTDYSNRFSTAANQLYKVDTNSQTVTWATGLTSSGGSLTKNGAGTLVLSGTNTYTAGTTVSSGTLRIDPTGSLQFGGGSDAITVTGSSTIANSGTINQTGTGRGIVENTGGLTLSITNGSATNSSALIQTADADAVRMSQANSNITLDNYGSIVSLNASAGGAQAIDWANITTGSNTLTNNSTGLVKAFEADAVRPGVNGVITNSGTILSITNTDSGSDGIDAQTNSGISITNSGSGLIEGGRHGITGGNTTGSGAYTMSVTNNAGATIQGDNGSGINIDGINGNELVTVVNHGTIIGDGAGDGVDVDGLVNLTNSGIIRSSNAFLSMSGGTGHSEGMSVGGGTIINSGTIEGLVAPGNTQAVGVGISLLGIQIESGPLAGTREAIYGNAVVTNQAGGLIRGESSFGIFVGGPASGFTVTINNNAGAIIRGGGTTDAAIQTGADNDTINNAGMIDGSSSGKAIDLAAGNDTLNITGGSASILGDVSGGAGTNALSIDPGSSNAFSYAGVFSNFDSVESKSGTVTLSGANIYTGTTQVTGGTLLINGNQSAATGAVSVSNAGSLLGGTGTIGGATTVNTLTTITGATNGSIGTLTLSSTLTFTGSSTYLVDINATAADKLAIGGLLDLSGLGDQINFNSLATPTAASYTLATYGGVLGTFDIQGNLPAGYTLVYLPTELDLVATPVPEPATWIGGALALTAFAFAKRSRNPKSQAPIPNPG